MKLRQLRLFLAVVDQGSLHGAARVLGLTPPAITAAIRELEKSLGVPLFIRSTNGVKLTDYGTVFQRRAHSLVGDIQRTQAELLAMRDGDNGEVSITASPAVACALLPHAFATFRGSMPNSAVVFRETALQAAFNSLRNGETDFAVVNYFPGLQWPDFVAHEDILSLPVFLVGRQGHPLAHARSLPQLLDLEWLITGEAGDDTDRAFNAYFEQQGLATPRRITRCQSLFHAITLLKTMDIITVSSEPTFRLELEMHKIERFQISETLPETVVATVVRRDRPLTAIAKQFLSCIEDAARSHALSRSAHPGPT
jgi:LysR family transcriptional regulator of abg operon